MFLGLPVFAPLLRALDLGISVYIPVCEGEEGFWIRAGSSGIYFYHGFLFISSFFFFFFFFLRRFVRCCRLTQNTIRI